MRARLMMVVSGLALVVVLSLVSMHLVENYVINQGRIALDRMARELSSSLESITTESRLMGALILLGVVDEEIKAIATHAPTLAPEPALDDARRVFGFPEAFVANQSGQVVAYSHDRGPSGVGIDISFRPYFNLAMAGLPNVYPAVSTISGAPTLYFAAPVRRARSPDSQPIGVMVFKLSTDDVDDVLMAAWPHQAFLLSPQHVVFAANRDEFLMRINGIATPEQARSIDELKQFGDLFSHTIPESLPFDLFGDRLEWADRSFIVESSPVHWHDPAGDWVLVLLQDTQTLMSMAQRVTTGATALIVWLLLLVIGDAILRARQSKAIARQRLQVLGYAVQHAPVPIVIADRRGLIEFVNEKFCALSGYTSEEFIGRKPGLVRSGQTPGRVHQELWQTLQAGKEWHGEFLNRNKHGQIYHVQSFIAPIVNAAGQVTHYVGVQEDVTERKRLDAVIASQLAFQTALIDTIPAIIYFTDSEARLIGSNRSFEEAFGVDREAILGHTLRESEHLPAVLRYDFFDEDIACLLTHESYSQKERTLLFADGRQHDCLYWKTTFMVADGSTGGLLTVLIDISQRKAMEEALNVSRQEAWAANRAKSEFLANMSHEIRTPLNGIIGMTRTLRRTAKDAEQAHKLDRIDQAANHLLRIINDILDMSKIEAGKLTINPEAFSLKRLLSGVVTQVASQAETKGLAIHLDIARDLPDSLFGDAVRLSQCLLNYANNAVKFTPKGSITIRARLVELSAGGLLLRFEVQDTGIGIAEEALNRMFSAFEQADRSTTRQFGGTGLGLAITRQLSKLMGGDVGVESTPGLGSRFWFSAVVQSVTTNAAVNLTPEPELATAATFGFEPARLLLAEDVDLNREVVLDLLDEVGLSADCAANGAIAVTMASAVTYELILMDMQMPVMDGLTATRALRQLPHYAKVPIIALTANAFSEDRVRCLEAGMNDFLTKPVRPHLLYATLAQWLKPAGGADKPVVPEPPAIQQRHPDPGVDLASRLRAQLAAITGLRMPEVGSFHAKPDRYLHYLQKYVETWADAMERLRELMSLGDRENALRMIHSLRGTSGQLGILDIETLASSVEDAMKNSAEDQLVSARVAALGQSLGSFCEAIGKIAP